MPKSRPGKAEVTLIGRGVCVCVFGMLCCVCLVCCGVVFFQDVTVPDTVCPLRRDPCGAYADVGANEGVSTG